MTGTRIPSTAFVDAWIQVDRTEDPRFFVQLLDSTRALLLERAKRVSLNPDAFHRWFIVPSMTHFKQISAFSAAEADFFLADLEERAEQGRYFCSRTYYSIVGSRSA